MGYSIVVRIRRFPVQTPLGARLGLGTQPCYEAPSDLQIENVKCSDCHWVSEAVPKVGRGAAK